MVDNSSINPPVRAGSNALQPPSAGSSAPPHPLDSEWHIHVNGQTYGPYTGHQLGDFIKEGRIDAGTQVIAKGSADWVLAGQERRLASLFRRPAQQDPPPINAAAGATVVHVTNQIASPGIM